MFVQYSINSAYNWTQRFGRIHQGIRYLYGIGIYCGQRCSISSIIGTPSTGSSSRSLDSDRSRFLDAPPQRLHASQTAQPALLDLPAKCVLPPPLVLGHVAPTPRVERAQALQRASVLQVCLPAQLAHGLPVWRRVLVRPRGRLRAAVEALGGAREAVRGEDESGWDGDAADLADALRDGEAVDRRAVGLGAVEDLRGDGGQVRVAVCRGLGEGCAGARNDAVSGAKGGDGTDAISGGLLR